MDQGGGTGLHLYSQHMSEGDGLTIELGEKPYKSKIRFEEILWRKKVILENSIIKCLNKKLSLDGDFAQ